LKPTLAVVNNTQSVCAIRLKLLCTEAHVLTHVLSLRGKQKQLKTDTGAKMLQDSSTFYLFRQCMPQSQACSKQWSSLVTAKTETLLPNVTHRQQNGNIIQVLHKPLP